MKVRFKLASLVLLAAFVSGCGMAQFRVPKEFEGKKQVEDPPLSLAPVTVERELA